MDNINICFVIACKYYRNAVSYLKKYVDNINNLYKNCSILIVDNNSQDVCDIYKLFNTYKNVTIITNLDLCKYELGAYKYGIKYLIKNNLVNKHTYYIFTQDTFIIHSYYDFNNLVANNVSACPIISSYKGTFTNDLRDRMSHYIGHNDQYLIKNTIIELGMVNLIQELTFCFASSFVLRYDKLSSFFELTKNIIIDNKIKSESCERIFSAILYLLNENKNFSIENTKVNEFMPAIYPGRIHVFDYFKKYIHGKQ
jgi:hypothetical protein